MSFKNHKLTISNRFIESVYQMDFVEKKILNILSHKIRNDKDDQNFHYKITIEELQTIFDKGNIYQNIKNCSKKILDRKIGFIDDENNEFDMINLFSRSRYKEGIYEISVTPELKSVIKNFEDGFTKYLLRNIRPLRSVYSIRIYELLKQHQKIGYRKFEIEELRRKLGCVDSLKAFSSFRLRVLDKAQEDLKKYCDITYSYELTRKWQKYHSITFLIEKNVDFDSNNNQPVLPGLDDLSLDSEEESNIELDMFNFGYRGSYKDLISSFGIERVEWYWINSLRPELEKLGGNDHGGLITKRFKDNCEIAYTSFLSLKNKEQKQKDELKNQVAEYVSTVSQQDFVIDFSTFISSEPRENQVFLRENFEPSLTLKNWGEKVQHNFLKWTKKHKDIEEA